MVQELMLYLVTGAFILMDILTGFAQAVANKTIDSSIMRRGLWHKLAYVFAIMLAVLCQYGTVYVPLGITVDLILPVCSFICLTELVSIIENLGRLNPDVANTKLLDLFSQSKSRRAEDAPVIDERTYNRTLNK